MGAGVVIAGGGLAAQRCAETLRRGGYGGGVCIVCGEPWLPYDRPPLSKELLAPGGGQEASTFRSAEWYGEREIELLIGVRARGLDCDAHTLALDDGRTLSFEQLVIATGARPRTLSMLEGYTNVSTLRTLDDARILRELFARRGRLAAIGAGFIGLEVAAAARSAGAEVTLIEIEALPLSGLLGEQIGRWFSELHSRAGVELVLSQPVSAVSGEGEVTALTLGDGRTITCDHVLVGVGVVPDLAWLGTCGLPTTGVPTDASGRSALRDIFAAGDAAAAFDPFLGRHALAGHWEAGSRQGAAVANAILGREPAAPPLPSFWSDQYGTRIQYLGHAQAADAISIDGDPAQDDFVAEYTRDGGLVAAVVVGRPRAVPALRDRLSYMTERIPA
ncbi:MAG: FAD-dependent oxidoreductase [Solirubrobacteraceae bacterium]|jgi:NADPH-dependent 2,4-dienoyl-CoA reductase/sulfur reductase-like enzyme